MIDKIKYWWFKYIKRKQLLTDDNGDYVTDKNHEESCENCGCLDCAELVISPLNDEVYGKKVWVWLCADCYNSEVMGI